MASAELATGRGILAIRFAQQEDRQSHSLVVDQATIGHSVEGRDDEAWPGSPPLQQLSIEDFGAGPVALLVGMAGRSHWSMSVETGDEGAVFDVACRLKGAPEYLGSTYLLDGFQLEPTNAPSTRSVVLTGKLGRLSISADEDDALVNCETRWDANIHQLQIVAITPSDDAETIRWRYRIQWAPHRDS